MKTIQIAITAILLIFAAQPVTAQNRAAQVVGILKGASIIAQDGKKTYLGKIDHEFVKDSIFNNFSKYGNEFNVNSIFNEFGTFGGEFGDFSPYNAFAAKPPMIIKKGKVIGYLTANKHKRGGISVAALMALKSHF